jgi:hypothetical protein
VTVEVRLRPSLPDLKTVVIGNGETVIIFHGIIDL